MASRINLNIVAAWRRLSLRGRLLLLVATAILPLLAFSLIAQYLAYRDAVARINDRTLVLAHSAAFGVEQELQKYIAVLEVLAVAPSLLAGDLVTFRRRVEDFLGPRLPNANLLLLSADGQQLMNTGLPPGAPLPVRQSLGSMRQAMETGGPTVSDLYHGVVVDRPVIGINVPVKREDGSVAQILSLNPASEAFDEIIRRQQMPAGWFVAVFDRQGVIVTRVPNREQFVGRQAAPQFLQHLMGQRDGVVENTTREGVPVLTAFVHSEHFGWAVAISVPRTELTKPAYDAFIGTLAGGG
ncbi:MAG: cache domain-containing protein, partial [Pseudomonadota bacterium]